MKSIVSKIAAVLMIGAPALADVDMMALEAGFKWNSVSVTGSDSTKQTLAFQLGGSAAVNFAPAMALRTGLFYSERPYSAETAGVSQEGKFTYFEIPLQFMYKFESYAGVYFGPTLAINSSSECSKPSGCRITDTKSMVVPLTIGAIFKFAPQMGANIFFETVPGDLAKDVGSSKALGANFVLTFD